MLLAIVAAVLAYRKANDTGRNGILWAFIAVAVFIGTQLIVGLALGMALGVFLIATERPESDFDKFAIVLNIVAIVLSFVATWGLLKYLDKSPQPNDFMPPPPPSSNDFK